MTETLKVGEIVLSTHGHDKGYYFAVTKIEGNKAFIADGRKRYLSNVKSKNVKHLKSVGLAVFNEIAKRLQMGQPVGNEKLYKAIKSQIEKIQED